MVTPILLKLSCHSCFHLLGCFRTSSMTFLPSTGPYHPNTCRGCDPLTESLLIQTCFYRTQVHIYNQMNIHINAYKIPLGSKRMDNKQLHFQASMALPVLPPWSGPARRAQPGLLQMLRSRPLKHAENREG